MEKICFDLLTATSSNTCMAIEVLIRIQDFREVHQVAHLMLIFEKSYKRFYGKNPVEVVSQANRKRPHPGLHYS